MTPLDFTASLRGWFAEPASENPSAFWAEMMTAISPYTGDRLAKVAVQLRDEWKYRQPPTIGQVVGMCRATPTDKANGHAGEMPWERKRREEAEPVEMSPERRAANLKKLHDLLAELRATSDMAKAKKTHWLDTPMPDKPLEGVTLSNALRRKLREKTDG